MLNRFAFSCVTMALLVFLTGCGGGPKGPRTVPAEGTITLDGEPIGAAAIVFVADGGEYSASALSEDDGSFSLNTFEYKTGAVPGDYKAIITRTVEITTAAGEMKGEEAEHAAEGGEAKQIGVKNDLPMKYSQPSDDFTFLIPDDGIRDLKIELTSD